MIFEEQQREHRVVDVVVGLRARELIAAVAGLTPDDPAGVSRMIGWLEANGSEDGSDSAAALRAKLAETSGTLAPVVGFTGTGGAGKSSVVDELVRRFRIAHPDLRIGLLLVDPTLIGCQCR